MIYFKMYNPAGLINQLMSIEIAVGIKEITGNEMTIYNILNGPDKSVPIYSASRTQNKRNGLVDNSKGFIITDILDWKDKESYFLSDKNTYSLEDDYQVIENLMLFYHDPHVNNKDLDFAEGRDQIFFSDKMHIKNTLGWYSRFFNNRTKELDHALSSVRFLPEYYELSAEIAKSLGTFNGVHLRLTDHVAQRVYTTKEMFDAGIEKINDGNKIVVCTDEPTTELLKHDGSRFVMLDEYILNNFHDSFSQFKYKDEVSFGLLNNLVMHHSKKFVGTIGSTYSGYIQRGMNQKNDIEWNWFDYTSDPVYEESGLGKYSWNSSKNVDVNNKQWYREWKESRLQ